MVSPEGILERLVVGLKQGERYGSGRDRLMWIKLGTEKPEKRTLFVKKYRTRVVSP